MTKITKHKRKLLKNPLPPDLMHIHPFLLIIKKSVFFPVQMKRHSNVFLRQGTCSSKTAGENPHSGEDL